MIRYYTGKDRFTKTWRLREETWDQFVARMTKHHPTGESMAEWKAMRKEMKDNIKDVGGFVGGILREGVRSPSHVTSRTLLTLDADDAHPDLWDMFELLYGCKAVMYQTHSWSPEKPKVRLVIPFKEGVDPTLAQAISHHVVADLGEAHFDPTTHQLNRLMFYPSVPRDVPHQSWRCDGDFFDVDAWVAAHPDWKDVSTWPVSDRAEKIVTGDIQKLGNPQEKTGIIGAFCRVYDIALAIETFLSDKYTEGTDDRYTWIGGSTSNGLHLRDNGLHAISYHSTDPICGICVNAWDLVRIHLFGTEDNSNNRMRELANADPFVIEQIDAERGSAAEAFAETGVANPIALFFRFDITARRQVFTPKFVADWYLGQQPVAVYREKLYRYTGGCYVDAEAHFVKSVAEALDVEFSGSRVRESLLYLTSTAPVIIDPYGGGQWLNVRNGLLDIETGELVPHREDHYSVVQVPQVYDPLATCPTVDAFISEFAGDHSELVWYMLGYVLMNTMRFEMSFILRGHGGNGKGTLLSLLTAMIGEDNVSNVALHKLESNTFAGSEVVGKMANIQSDLPAKLLEAEGVVKQLTSGDRTRFERKNKEGFSANPRAKLLFSANELSVSKDNSDGFFRKWCIIPFEKTFSEQPERRAQLFKETEGMLAKAVEYAIKLSKMRRFPGQGAIDDYRMTSDSVYAFIQDCCERGAQFETSKSDMYLAYTNYCYSEGVHPVKQKTLGSKLMHHLGITEKRTKHARFWVGVTVSNEMTD